MTVRSVDPSATLRLNERCARLQAEGRTVYRFGFGQSPFPPPERVVAALAGAAGRHDYAPVQGLSELRHRIAAFHSDFDGREISADEVIVGSGSKILLYNSLLALEDAVVIVPQPSWVTYVPQAILTHNMYQPLATTYAGRWRVDPDRLDAALSEQREAPTKVLILNYPGNPDGLSYTESELRAIADVLRRHEAWVISDEIYALLHHAGRHVSMAAVHPERTLVTGGMSKWCGTGGWRLGVEILSPEAPAAIKDALLAIAGATYSCAATPVQIAACEAYVDDDVTRNHLEAQRMILGTVARRVHGVLRESTIAFHPSEGGFYLLLDFEAVRHELEGRGVTNDVELCERLLEDTGVALLPGSAFHMGPDTLTARLAYVDFDGQKVIDAYRHGDDLDSVIDQECCNVMVGASRLVDWIG